MSLHRCPSADLWLYDVRRGDIRPYGSTGATSNDAALVIQERFRQDLAWDEALAWHSNLHDHDGDPIRSAAP
jgi:hypothetical protein